MSSDEIIRAWKNGEKPANGTTPPNPAGDDALSDDQLESVAGGFATEFLASVGCCTVYTYDDSKTCQPSGPPIT